MLTKYDHPVNEPSHFTTPRDVLMSEYKFTTLHHTINIPASRISLRVSAHLLHLIFCPSLWLYYSPQFPYVNPIIMVALIISPQRAVTSQIQGRRNAKAKIGNRGKGTQTRMMNLCIRVAQPIRKFQNVVLTSSCPPFYTYPSDAPSLRLLACHFPVFDCVLRDSAACSPDRLCRNSAIGNGCYAPGSLLERVRDRYRWS